MSNNEETGPSNQDADEMDYEGEQEYVDYLTAKQGQGLQVGLDDGIDADIDTDAPAPMAAPRPMAVPRPAGKVPAGKIPVGKVPKRRSRRSRGYENLTN